MFCAFRLYGDFVWPPAKTGTQPPPTLRKQGVVEINYARPHAPKGKWRAFVTWRPAGSPTDEPPPIALEDIYALGDPDTWFAEHGDEPVSLWIDGNGDQVGGEQVAFRGAFLFEQYKPGKTKPTLLWPLVRQSAYHAGGEPVLSELIIGQPDGNDSYRFNLQLPTPFPQTTLGKSGVPTFPFSVLYSPRVASAAVATTFSTLVGGPIGVGPAGGTGSFKFRTEYEPKTRILGRFGFAPNGSDGGAFAQYSGNKHPDKDVVNVDRYWPKANTARERLALLQAIGVNWQTTKTALQLARATPAEMSLSLPENANQYVFRLTFKAPGGSGSAGDLGWEDGQFYFDLADEIGGRLTTSARHLHLDCVVSWTIDDDIWRQDAQPWTLQMRLRPHWQETIAATGKTPFGSHPALGPDGPSFTLGTLPAAATAMRASHTALDRVASAQPQSLMPDLSVPRTQDVRFALYAPPVLGTFSDNGDIEFPKSMPAQARAPLRLSLIDGNHLIGKETAAPLQLTARFPSFFTGAKSLLDSAMALPQEEADAAALELPFHLSHDSNWLPESRQSVTDQNDRYFASFAVGAKKDTVVDWSGRLGSISFVAIGAPLTYDGTLKTTGPGVGYPAFDIVKPSTERQYPTAVQVNFELPFTRAIPFGVDMPLGGVTEEVAPLLVPLDAEPDTTEGAFGLRTAEYVGPVADRLLLADVFDRSIGGGEREYVVLGETPFSILRFSSRVLGARGDAESGAVASYSSASHAWELKQVSEYYRYSFPPQAVGESADKPRRLEIHDLVDDTARDYPGEATRPAVERPFYGVDEADRSSGLKRRAVEFRLTPSADLWIRPSDVDRRYFMAEWQSHDIFRQRGELGLGAALAALRAEFLYGLPVGVETARERGPARQARVAEIEALIGRPVGQTDTKPELGQRWNALSRALSRRPERLEVWAHDPGSVLDFTPARFEDGVTFALRQTALARSPVAAREDADDYRAAPTQPRATSLRYHPQGLSGGALWPVESANLFDALVNNPTSEGGTIEGIAFSPLGGDAAQKAMFLGGQVSIISQTRNGFIERQKVEVLGRIAPLWHRAKHVVVYERTVNPSAQFAPLKSEDPFGTRTRRPVLRKVREYIELLQPERSYPDSAQASPRSAGFLDRVRFNSRIINVDSAWSRDVGKVGWEIPLWNRKSALQRPQVYPLPDIAFCSVSEGEGERPVVAQECLDPDFLYFFADFDTGGSNTDAWPSRLGVDYANMPLASTVAAAVDGRSSDPEDTDQRRPNVSRFLPGVRRFTWRVAPAAVKVALNAGRAGKPVYVGLDSVSFMRAGPDASGAGHFERLRAVLAASAGIVADPAIAGVGYWGKGDAGTGLKAEFTEAIAALQKATYTPAAVTAFKDWWTDKSDGLRAEITAELNGPFGKAKDIFQTLKNAGPLVDKGQANCDRLRAEAVGVIQRKAMLIEALLRDWEAQADLILAAPPGGPPLTTKSEAIDALAEEIRRAIKPAFDDAEGGAADIGASVERARAIVADLQADADAAIARSLARLKQFVAAYDRDKPWSDARREAFYLGLFAAVGGVAGDITSAIEETRQRLATELDDSTQQVAGHLAKGLQALAASEVVVLEGLLTFETTVENILKPARQAITPLLPAAQGGKLDDVLAKLPELHAKIDASGIAQESKDGLKGALDTLEQTAGTLQSTATDISGVIDAAEQVTIAHDQRLTEAMRQLHSGLQQLAGRLMTQVEALAGLVKQATDAGLADFAIDVEDFEMLFSGGVLAAGEWIAPYLAAAGKPADLIVSTLSADLTAAADSLRGQIATAALQIDAVAGDVAEALSAAQQALSPAGLLDGVVIDQIVKPALRTLLQPMPETFDSDPREEIRIRLASASATIAEAARQLSDSATTALDHVSTACSAVFEGADAVYDYMNGVAKGGEAYVADQINKANDYVLNDLGAADIARLATTVAAVDQTVRRLQNDLSRSVETARAYGDRVADSIGKLGTGGPMATASNVLKLYSAVTSAPEIAALKADIDRIRSGFDELSDTIKTTKATALFDRLGDELKALGLSLPFDGISDRLLPVDLSGFDIGAVFRNFGGARLDKLFSGYKLPAGVRDAVRITHDFDEKQARAWVQVDIDVPMAGRRSLFSIGVFKADFVDMHLTGQARFEISKDSDKVTQTGHGRIGTIVDLVVANQSMVTFEKFGLNFSRETGLQVEFDPKNIRLNPTFQFIQDFLSTLFPDEIGGMTVLKRDGIPIGLEHEFSLPPMSLNFGTSGVSNISISNRFQLTAYPDFVLADRFGLSKPEQPFIFSIFIIGGTGYVQVEAEYRPFSNELTVAVEAAAGGSASIAFAFGPFVGQVFITLSVSLTYRKLLGASGGGLSIGAVLVIAGYVNVAGIVTIGIYLMLRMTYRDNGQIDADGVLSVTIRISRFFKITARANITYKLRGGRSQSQVSGGVEAAPVGELAAAQAKLEQSIEKLKKARA